MKTTDLATDRKRKRTNEGRIDISLTLRDESCLLDFGELELCPEAFSELREDLHETRTKSTSTTQKRVKRQRSEKARRKEKEIERRKMKDKHKHKQNKKSKCMRRTTSYNKTKSIILQANEVATFLQLRMKRASACEERSNNANNCWNVSHREKVFSESKRNKTKRNGLETRCGATFEHSLLPVRRIVAKVSTTRLPSFPSALHLPSLAVYLLVRTPPFFSFPLFVLPETFVAEDR